MNYNDYFILDTYSPTGLVWKVDRNNRTKAGAEAGYLHDTGYYKVRLNKKSIPIHRVIYEMLNGPVPDGFILDHINGDRKDNRLENLRLATLKENSSNKGKAINNTSGFKGVSFTKKINKWRARISQDGKYYHLGYFDTPEAAGKAYEEHASKLFGEFNRKAN